MENELQELQDIEVICTDLLKRKENDRCIPFLERSIDLRRLLYGDLVCRFI